MAARPIEVGQPDVVDQVLLIPIADIDQGTRLRPVDSVWAAALGKVIAQEGQRTPIEVCRLPGQSGYTLVVGGHRLEGARLEGHAVIRAIIVSNDRAERRMREVSENIWRKGLDPVDRAAFVAELVELKKVALGVDPNVAGRATSAAVRWQKVLDDKAADASETISVAYGWAEEVGETLGFTGRTIRNDLLLTRIPVSLIERLRAARHPVLTNGTQLRALAKLDENSQSKVVDLLVWPGASLNYGQPKTVAEAIAHPLGPKPAGPKPASDDKRLSAFIGSFGRMSVAERAGALDQLAGMYQHLFVQAVGRLPADGKRAAAAQLPGTGRAEFSKKHVEYREAALAALDDARELLDGLLEDQVLDDERHGAASAVAKQVRLTRFTIAGNGFELIDDQQRRAIVDATVAALDVIDGPIADRLRAAVGVL